MFSGRHTGGGKCGYRTERLLKDTADCAFGTSLASFTLEHPLDRGIIAALRATCSIDCLLDQAYQFRVVVSQPRSPVTWGEHPIGNGQLAA